MLTLAMLIKENFPELHALIQGPMNEFEDSARNKSYVRELVEQLRRIGVSCTQDKQGFTATCGGTSVYIHGTTSGLNTKKARLICKDKYQTKRILSENGFRVSQGYLYGSDEMPAEADLPLSYPLVLKPVDGMAGAGVRTDIRNYDEVKSYWQTVRPGRKILLEEFVEGLDLRCCVVDGKLVAAGSRINAHVFGDGISTVRELIAKKTAMRSKNPDLKKFALRVDLPIDLDSIPLVGEMVVLNSLGNISSGGDSVNVTPFLSDPVKKTIEDAVKCIEGANCVGVDILATSFSDPGKLCFIEFNTSAGFMMHKIPAFGGSIAFGEAIAKYMKRQLLTTPLADKSIKEILARNKDNPDIRKLAWEIKRARNLQKASAPTYADDQLVGDGQRLEEQGRQINFSMPPVHRGAAPSSLTG
jgi:D-alanine-D-alanine ligase-like ATP-grasp enzyme